VPESIVAAVSLPEQGWLATMMQPAVITTAIAIAFIASAETLLSAAAVDRMHDGVRTNYNKELWAQGVGNVLCGAAGALPMTGVIVRSSANVQAGGKTRLSTILHGVWILAFVALLPWLLREIPMAALAGILVVTGVRLVSLDHVRHLLHRYGPLPAVVWAATLITVVATDLLTGVLVGIGLSLIEMVPHLRQLRLKMEDGQSGDAHEVSLNGTATFLSLPKLSAKLESLPAAGPVILNVERLSHIDHTCAEMVREWVDRRRSAGGPVELLGATGRMQQLAAH
jgi:MFS superfamily sulfate permease-like transporter